MKITKSKLKKIIEQVNVRIFIGYYSQNGFSIYEKDVHNWNKYRDDEDAIIKIYSENNSKKLPLKEIQKLCMKKGEQITKKFRGKFLGTEYDISYGGYIKISKDY